MPWSRLGLVSLTGGVLMLVTLWFHAFWVFGVEMDYLNGGRQPMAPSLPITTLFFAQLALAPAILTTILLAMTLSLTRHRPGLWRGLALPLWVFLWFLSAGGIASQFAVDFGTTWGFMEPFRALMAHAILTPASLLTGLAGLWFALR
jgi:hypothetical protein